MRILIVGGGIAGLALAKALELRGMVADVVERQAGEPAGGTGLYLPGNAARAIGALGLLPQVTERAAPIGTQKIFNAAGRLLSAIPTAPVWESCGPCLSLPRNAFQAILQGALAHTKVRFGAAVTGLRQSGAACAVTFENGAAESYDLVVAADGVNSSVRRAAFPGAAPAYAGNICWRFITRNTAGIDCWTAMLGGSRALLAIPVGGGDVYVYADMTVPAAEIGRYSQSSPLATLFAGFGAPVFPLVEGLPAGTNVHFGRIEQVSMPAWVSGRVVLIGDAAHATSPSMAEGAGMALEDALVLAEVLATERDVDTALAAYAARRRPRVDWVQQQSVKRDKMRALPAFARTAIMTLAGRKIYRSGYAPLLQPI